MFLPFSCESLTFPTQIYLQRSEYRFTCFQWKWNIVWPITVAARYKAWTVFTRSNAGIVGSNPSRGMHICVRVYTVFVFFCV
jgi:hypothetical protein